MLLKVPIDRGHHQYLYQPKSTEILLGDKFQSPVGLHQVNAILAIYTITCSVQNQVYIRRQMTPLCVHTLSPISTQKSSQANTCNGPVRISKSINNLNSRANCDMVNSGVLIMLSLVMRVVSLVTYNVCLSRSLGFKTGHVNCKNILNESDHSCRCEKKPNSF